MPGNPISPESAARCVARTFSIVEAKQIADRFEVDGYKADIVENKHGSMAIYEVWVSRKNDILESNKH